MNVKANALLYTIYLCCISINFIVEGPQEHLRRILLIKRYKELVNFEELAPHLRTEGLLDEDEYLDITQRNGVSCQQHFKLFVTECLLKPGKGNVVKKFINALRNEKNHKGHNELLKTIEKDERIMNKTGDYIHTYT